MLTMNRIILFFIFTAIFTVVYGTSAVTSEPTEEEIEEVMSFFEEIVDTIDGIGIFTHNTTIALPMFIPGFGVVWGLFSAYSTGFAYSAIATANPEVAQLNPLAILLTPFGLMEVAAYSIGMSRSALLAKNVFQKNWNYIKNERNIIAAEIGIVITLLLIGGIVEMWMIETAQGIEDVEFSLNSQNQCELEPDPGLCKAYFPKYYFDEEAQACQEFIYGGCGGVVPFDTMDECTQQCSTKP